MTMGITARGVIEYDANQDCEDICYDLFLTHVIYKCIFFIQEEG